MSAADIREVVSVVPLDATVERLERAHEEWKRSILMFGEQFHQPKIASRFLPG
jgi:hypothetical protein